MSKTTYNELKILHKHLDEITIFIEGIVQNENAAVVLACQVFEELGQLEQTHPFDSEAKRKQWLFVRSRHLSIDYLAHHRHEAQKAAGIRAAIHDYTPPAI